MILKFLKNQRDEWLGSTLKPLQGQLLAGRGRIPFL